jgi:hypothetical protein
MLEPRSPASKANVRRASTMRSFTQVLLCPEKVLVRDPVGATTERSTSSFGFQMTTLFSVSTTAIAASPQAGD